MKRVLVTGSSGLIGSEAVEFFDARGWETHGVDNNLRRDFFGPDGDTTWNLDRLRKATRRFTHHALDIRDREGLLGLVRDHRPDPIVRCAAQPSHDLARDRPFDDFEVNAMETLNLLEGARRHCPEAPFVFMRTNKVYGAAPTRSPSWRQRRGGTTRIRSIARGSTRRAGWTPASTGVCASSTSRSPGWATTVCYISDLRRFRADYPGWAITRSLEDILRELARPG